jgi:exodeoxyribonuclease VII small subunit
MIKEKEKKNLNYAQQFSRLEQIAQQLSRQDGIVDIDQLLPLIDEAMTAYQFCQSRIDALEALLNEKLNMGESPTESSQ